MSSSVTTSRRLQTRSLSPNRTTGRPKALKTDANSDCKGDRSAHKSGDKSGDTSGEKSASKSSSDDSEHDCPAFRLRPRRSTPKPSPSSPGKRFSALMAMMNRLKYLKDGSAVKRKLMFNKQKVYPSTYNSDDLFLARVIPPRSPSCSIAEEIAVSPFVQKISPFELEADKEYGANYVSLRIRCREQIETNDQKILKLIASEVDYYEMDVMSSSHDLKASVNESVNESGERKIAIYLYDSYVSCRAETNKVINIVKFKTQSKLEHNQHIGGDFPYAIVVNSCGPAWVPFVSITSKWTAPEDPRELNRTLVQSPPDDKMTASSTITTSASATTLRAEASCSSHASSNNKK